MNRQSINIRHHLILFLGSNRKLYKEIDKIYNLDEEKYYVSYKNSDFFNDIVKQKKSTLVESYINKVIGIVETAYANNDLSNILRLIQKGYGKVYNFFKNAKFVDYNILAKQLFTEKFTFENDETIIYGNMIVMIYLSKALDIEIVNFNAEMFLGPYVENFYRTIEGENLILRNKLSKEIITDLYKKIDLDLTDINKNKISLNIILENLIDRKAMSLALEYIDKNNFEFDIKTNDKKLKNSPQKQKELFIKATPLFFDAREQVFQLGIYKYLGVYSQWLDVLGIDSTDIFIDTTVNKDTFDLVLHQVYNSLQVGQIKEYDLENTFMSLLFIYNLSQTYKQTKKLYLDDNKEELFMKLIEKENFIEEKEKKIKEDFKVITTMKLNSEKEIQNLKSELEFLKKQNKNLQETIDTKNSYEKEVISLRNYIYDNSVVLKNIDEDEISIEDKINFINSKNITIFGGHPVWSKKLKEKCFNVTFIDTDKLNLKLNFLSNMELVIFTTNYLSHSMYKKVMKSPYIEDINISYLDQINIDMAIQKLYDLCKNIS